MISFQLMYVEYSAADQKELQRRQVLYTCGKKEKLSRLAQRLYVTSGLNRDSHLTMLQNSRKKSEGGQKSHPPEKGCSTPYLDRNRLGRFGKKGFKILLLY